MALEQPRRELKPCRYQNTDLMLIHTSMNRGIQVQMVYRLSE